MHIRIIFLFSFIIPFLFISSLLSQKVKLTKIIDTNLFEINKQDTIKLANVEIPSKTTSDSLLKEYFIPHVLKYENEKLLDKYFKIIYADKVDSLRQVRAVYLYNDYQFSSDFMNEKILLKGFGKYVPFKDCEEQQKCKSAAMEAQENERGIWKDGIYFLKKLGVKEISLHFGNVFNEKGNKKNIRNFGVNYQNRQNRSFSYKVTFSLCQYDVLRYPEYNEYDSEPPVPWKVTEKTLLLNIALNSNAKYMGVEMGMAGLMELNKDKRFENNVYFFLPTIGYNLGNIKQYYLSAQLINASFIGFYQWSVSGHYFFPSPFCSAHFYYYWNNHNFNTNESSEYRFNINYSMYEKVSFKLDVSVLHSSDNDIDNNFFTSLGIGYLFH